MWYAIEYAYGRDVVNNGNRADTVMSFSSRRLRDRWVGAGKPETTAAGYREILSARSPLVRNALGRLVEGDGEAWYLIALDRVDASPTLNHYAAEILYDWPDSDHWVWVATESEKTIVSWAKRIHETWEDEEVEE